VLVAASVISCTVNEVPLLLSVSEICTRLGFLVIVPLPLPVAAAPATVLSSDIVKVKSLICTAWARCRIVCALRVGVGFAPMGKLTPQPASASNASSPKSNDNPDHFHTRRNKVVILS
jgi:hypothetical protein